MISQALTALTEGRFILLYDFDDRERETDFAIRADAVGPREIVTMRRDGGGLICTAILQDAARRLGLPYAREVLQEYAVAEKTGDIPYDPKNQSSFSLWVNHRDTFTGITDRDRALTITSIAEEVKLSLNGGGCAFSTRFRSPGHVAVLIAAEKLLDQRHGQTELSIALAQMAGINPAVTICEMLDENTGNALKKDDALRYARDHGLVFIEGSEVLEAWDKMKESA